MEPRVQHQIDLVSVKRLEYLHHIVKDSREYRGTGRSTSMFELAASWAARGSNVCVIMASSQGVRQAREHIKPLIKMEDYARIDFIDYQADPDYWSKASYNKKIFLDHFLLDNLFVELSALLLHHVQQAKEYQAMRNKYHYSDSVPYAEKTAAEKIEAADDYF